MVCVVGAVLCSSRVCQSESSGEEDLFADGLGIAWCVDAKPVDAGG